MRLLGHIPSGTAARTTEEAAGGVGREGFRRADRGQPGNDNCPGGEWGRGGLWRLPEKIPTRSFLALWSGTCAHSGLALGPWGGPFRLGNTGCPWASLGTRGNVRHYWALSGTTGIQGIPGNQRPFWTLLGITGHLKALLNITGHNGASLGITGHHWASHH